ncbi:aquaporin [Dermatophagoides farinae]|uniref:Aquaporin n=1 Tax=Dermatophagoides farinae TaxID=6954 RepID=A0A9D4P269_DERFA|nr:aquaporin [Dermatophagoides farinae]
MHNLFKEFFAELIGTAILMLLGISGAACTVLTKAPMNLACAFGYAFGVIIASIFAGPISGAHINPAITIAFSVIGKFQWRKVPVYLIAQYIGSFIGSALAYSIYFEAIHGFDLDNGYNNDNVTEPSMITAVQHCLFMPYYSLVMNWPHQNCLQTLTTGLLILTFIIGFNYNCGAILNPARDLAPRILLSFIGYESRVFEPLNYNFWWAVGIVAPHSGAIIGAIGYFYMAKMRQSFVDGDNIFSLANADIIQAKSISLNNSSSQENGRIINHHHNHHQQQQMTNRQMFHDKVNTEFHQ